MAFFGQAISTLSTLVIALGAGLGVWGVVNLLEGYGQDNPGANTHGAQATVEYSVQVQKESQSLVRHMRCQYALRMARKKCFCDFDVFLLCQDVSPMACH